MAFTGDELLSLAALPHLIGAAAASVSPSGVFGTAKEFFANSRALLEGAESYPQNRLIRQLVPGIAESHSEATASVQKVRDWTADRLKASGVDFSDKLRALAIGEARTAATLLATKASPEEAREYGQWAVAVAERVAQAASEGGFLGFGGERITAAERAFIVEVKRAFDRSGAGAVTAAAPRLAGRKVIITAGPTHEPIDAEHFIVTHDTGQLGYKLAEAAVRLGAQTILVSGPVNLPLPPGVQVMPVDTALEMLSTCERELPCDIAILTAAAAKWRLARQGAVGLELHLVENPDIVRTIATRRDGRPTLVVGCTTERANAIENGRAKFREAACDLILIVDESPAAESLISDLLTVHLVEGDKVETWSRLGSNEIVRRLMELLAARLAATSLHEGE